MSREPLPARRGALNFEFEHRHSTGAPFTYTAAVGFYPDGRVGEVFLGCGRTGTDVDIAIKESAIALSLALQHGCTLAEIRSTFLRDGNGRPEGALGTLVDLIVAEGYGTPEAGT